MKFCNAGHDDKQKD